MTQLSNPHESMVRRMAFPVIITAFSLTRDRTLCRGAAIHNPQQYPPTESLHPHHLMMLDFLAWLSFFADFHTPCLVFSSKYTTLKHLSPMHSTCLDI